jgi:hypothetical protein
MFRLQDNTAADRLSEHNTCSIPTVGPIQRSFRQLLASLPSLSDETNTSSLA